MGIPATDLTNCEDEPIRVPGAIQPHGALVAVAACDGVVSHASANLSEFFGIAATEAIGRRLADLIPKPDSERVAKGMARLEDGSGTVLFTVRLNGRPCEAIAHRAGDRIIVEFEPTMDSEEGASADLARATRDAVSELRKAPSLDRMYDVCADRVREISGFDRVMVYRFDADWNGQVVAEARRHDLEPFLGLHYPASDIPAQARELYVRNWLRFIADRDYTRQPIVPECGPASPAPLDLSQAVLRSVSPIHLQYLRNMGVGASMSISLLKDDQLWGLVACHHYSPRFVPYDVRAACELLGQILSMQLASREEQEQARYGARMQSVRAALATRLRQIEDVGLALTEVEPSLLEFMEATGAAVVIGGDVVRIGLTPNPEDLLEIADRIAARGPADVFATERLGAELNLDAVGAVAAGLLSVPIAGEGRDRLMWFRPEEVREVDWAGDPSKSVQKGDGAARLSPRGSFTLWKQVVRGRSRPWHPAEVGAALDLRKDLAEILAGRAGELAHQNRAKEEMLASERAARGEAERLSRMKDEFVATLSHELRTPLAAILGWTHIIRRGADESTLKSACEVIERNARAQVTMIDDLLDVSRITSGKLRMDMQPTDVAAAVVAAVDSIAPTAQVKGVKLEGVVNAEDDAYVTGDPTRLQQIFWNLLSNAVKFTPRGGRVQIVLERVNSHVEIVVSDSGQGIEPAFLPHVFDRFRQQDADANRQHGGLGLGLSIVRHLVELHGGSIYARSEGEGTGAEFVVSLPLRAVASRGRRRNLPEVDETEAIEETSLDLGGARILVLDDEQDARDLVWRLLEDRGAVVTAAGSAEEALEHYRGGGFDAIISDVGMPTVDGHEFIRRIRALETSTGLPRRPAVALTAYARPEDRRRALMAGYQAHVAKPVEPGEIIAVIASLVGKT